MARAHDAAGEPLVCPRCGAAYGRDERFCAACGLPLTFSVQDDDAPEVNERHRIARKIKPQLSEGRLVRVAGARNQAEGEFIQAMLLEGTARWFSGQTDHARPAIARRLREGHAPSFPPGVRDALLLGGTVIDLMAREEGEASAAQFACRLEPRGPRAALAEAFGGRPLRSTEQAWRSHVKRLAAAA